MLVNPQQYDREERKKATWWSSRHNGEKRSSQSMRRSRRITLIDLLLLALMAGLLAPWLMSRADAAETEPYRIRLSKGFDTANSVVLRVSLSNGKKTPAADEIVGWILYGPDDEPFHREVDLAPAPGGRRIFVADVGERQLIRCEIRLGERTVVRELTMDEP